MPQKSSRPSLSATFTKASNSWQQGVGREAVTAAQTAVAKGGKYILLQVEVGLDLHLLVAAVGTSSGGVADAFDILPSVARAAWPRLRI